MIFVNLPKVAMPYVHEWALVAGQTWAAISIADPDEEPPVIVETVCCKGILYLKFHDVDVAKSSNYTLFNESQAQQILEFAARMKDAKVDIMLIHCHAGICRSSAVAAALTKVYGQNDDHFFANYIPNRRVYRVLLETHNKGKDHAAN